jgi:hypothetical protein
MLTEAYPIWEPCLFSNRELQIIVSEQHRGMTYNKNQYPSKGSQVNPGLLGFDGKYHSLAYIMCPQNSLSLLRRRYSWSIETDQDYQTTEGTIDL